MKLINKSTHSLSFSIPYKVTDNNGKEKTAFKMVIVNPNQSVRVERALWEKIADRKSVKALQDTKKLLISEADDGLLYQPEGNDLEGEKKLEKERNLIVEDLKLKNWKRAKKQIEGLQDIEVLKALKKIETRKSVKEAVESRPAELKEDLQGE